MNKKWFGTAMVAVVMGTVLVGCGNNDASGQSDNSAQELHLTMGDDLPSADIALATDQYSFNILSNTMEGFVRLDKDGKAVPGLATNWDISQDGKTYTFHLRDAKWSNGDAVTANDFVYSWKRTLDPKTASQYAFMLSSVKGAKEYNSGKGSADEIGIKAVDDKTVEVTLNNPTPYFLNQMAFPTFFPLDQKFVESKGKDFGTSVETSLSNGPFKITDWKHETNVNIEKNADYWDVGNVKLQKVTFDVVKDTSAMVNMYESGQIDRVGLVRDFIDQYKDKADEYSVENELTNGYLIFNPAIKGLENSKIRTALTWAVDRDMYADIIYHNGTKGATGFVPNGTSDSAGGDFRKTAGDTLTKHTDAEAKQMLQDGLKEAGMSASDLKLKLLIDDTDVAKKAGEFLKEQWRTKIGVDVEIENVPFKLRLERERKGDYIISSTLWGADYNDPMTFLDMFVTKNEFNSVNYSNPEYDKLINEAKITADPKQRAQELVDAEKLLMKDMPIGPIFFRGKAYATKPYVKGLISFPFGVDYELKTTYIQGK
ncbi:peptide ABC transporter substrate-binding protein [Tumebacillus sp. ITR2]|uniref:Peptide ABC transporter substrate-binding protein n=1 Tax=Tumebacillus amylolyticus TaxID=2801339 RepID=A0ABS1J8Q2_9BACL|nr:peptide ABC transporter substrate-binding protein [Tumebacillus amylolyticus]MBL0386658.1 peptide ABC transporter substrate-binding protein [Tumebacillus amylolyticus]